MILMSAKKRIHTLFSLSILKTIYFNFHYFPFQIAVKFPVLVTSNVLFKRMKGTIILHSRPRPGLVKIGFDGVGIFDSKRSKAIWQVEGTVEFCGKANIGQGSKISVGGGATLKIGNNLTVTAESSIIANHRIIFGDDCLLSWDILCMDTDFHKISHNGKTINENSEVHIGNHVWVGCRTTILKGSSIPDGSVVGANSVVAGKFDKKNVIIAGNPAKICKDTIEWNK